jgi:hypothetical protein
LHAVESNNAYNDDDYVVVVINGKKLKVEK